MKKVTSLKKHCIEFKISPTKANAHDFDVFVAENFTPVYKLLLTLIQKHKHIKVQVAVNLKLGKFALEDRNYVTIRPWFCSSMLTLYARGSKYKIRKAFRQIIGFYDAFIKQGSGWTLDRVLSARITVARYKPFRGGRRNKSKLPSNLVGKKACLSIRCKDDMCFQYSVLAGMFPTQKHPERPSSYDLSVLNVEGLTFPLL